jgi:hypothetical protein
MNSPAWNRTRLSDRLKLQYPDHSGPAGRFCVAALDGHRLKFWRTRLIWSARFSTGRH